MTLIKFGFTFWRFQVVGMNKLGNVVAGREADMHGVPGASTSIVIFEPLSQGMSGDADNGIHLRVKRFRAPQGVHRNAVLLYFVDGSFEVLFANKRQKPNVIVCPPEYPGRHYVIYFSPLGLKLADHRLQVLIPSKNLCPSQGPSGQGKYNSLFGVRARTKALDSSWG